jgi:DNA-binding response OmpR family regulator
MMPKMDGITVLKKVRAAGNSIPILMLTAKAEIDDRVLGLDSGADDYLTKPFSMKELLARIRAMTRRQTDATDSVLSFGNIALDRSKFLLSSPKESLRLANKEFQMLEMLLVHPGQVISADQFMEKIWGYDSDAEQNVVWVYISYLRKKLAALDATVTIRAVRGLGYTLEESHD